MQGVFVKFLQDGVNAMARRKRRTADRRKNAVSGVPRRGCARGENIEATGRGRWAATSILPWRDSVIHCGSAFHLHPFNS